MDGTAHRAGHVAHIGILSGDIRPKTGQDGVFAVGRDVAERVVVIL